MIGSLQTRLLLAIGGLGVLALLVVALAARQGTRQGFLRLQELERTVERTGPDEVAAVAERLRAHCCAPDDLAAATQGLRSDAVVLVTRADDGSLIVAGGVRAARARRIETRREGQELQIEMTVDDGRALEVVKLRFASPGVPVTLEDGRPAVLHVIDLPSPERERLREAFLEGVDLRLLVATGLVGLFAMAVTWAIVRHSVGPLDELRRATSSLARGALATRVTPRGSREVVDLGRDFNVMAESLERQQALRRQLLHDVAHELRTPLTALQCRLETLIDGMAPDPGRAVHDLHDEVRHLTRLVDDLQDAALAEAREIALDLHDVVLRDVVGSAVAAAGLEGDSRLRLDVAHSLRVRADATRLRQVILNLLTNAARHTPAGGTIAIAAARGADGVTITVRNTGSHLTPDEAAHVFDRFYRTDPSRQRATGGSGLGLAIVKHLVEAHGGRVWVTSDAGGVTFGVALPGGADHSLDVADSVVPLDS